MTIQFEFNDLDLMNNVVIFLQDPNPYQLRLNEEIWWIYISNTIKRMKLVHLRNLPYLSYFSKIKNIFLITSHNKLSELTNCSNYANYSKLDGHTNPVILKSSRIFEKIRIYYNTNQKVLR